MVRVGLAAVAIAGVGVPSVRVVRGGIARLCRPRSCLAGPGGLGCPMIQGRPGTAIRARSAWVGVTVVTRPGGPVPGRDPAGPIERRRLRRRGREAAAQALGWPAAPPIPDAPRMYRTR